MERLSRHFGFCLLLLLALTGFSRAQSMNHVTGVVEGFYWPMSDAVFGQYGAFSFEQRVALLNLLAELKLGIYWYAPQSVSTLDAWDGAEAEHWSHVASVSASSGVRVVYGLRPGYLESDFSEIISKVQELRDAGLKWYSLNFDDASGASSVEQKNRQISLAATLNTTFPDMTAYVFVPSEYYQSHDGAGTTLPQWAQSLAIADGGLNVSVAFGLTGPSITPSSMDPSKFPDLPSGRRTIFWDNWIAVDTNTRLPWGLVGGSARIHSDLFTPAYGYVMNLAYPLERNIHQLACLSSLANTGNTSCDAQVVASKWASWLFDHGFAHSHSIDSLSEALTQAILDDPSFTSIEALETAYPGLADVFSTPPDLSSIPNASPRGEKSEPDFVTPTSAPNSDPVEIGQSPAEPTPVNEGLPLSPSLLVSILVGLVYTFLSHIN
jgi:hypothetical protein